LAKAERLKKSHISHICRRNPKRYRIIAFAQEVAAKKIQNNFRNFIKERKMRMEIKVQEGLKRFKINYSKAVIRKYAIQYLLRKKEKAENFNQHKDHNLDKIIKIQRTFQAKRN